MISPVSSGHSLIVNCGRLEQRYEARVGGSETGICRNFLERSSGFAVEKRGGRLMKKA